MFFKVLTKFPNMSTLELTRSNPSILSTSCWWAFDGRKRQKQAKVVTKLQRDLAVIHKSAKYWQVVLLLKIVYLERYSLLLFASQLITGSVNAYVSAEQVCPSIILQSPDVLRFGGWGHFNGEWWVVALVFVSGQVSVNRRMSWLASGFLSAPTKDVIARCQSDNLTLCKGPSNFALLSHRQLEG